MRVGILALLHESNTFISAPTTLEHFRQNTLLTGSGVREKFTAAHHEVGGFFLGLANAGLEAVPIFAARAMPYGTITAETFDTLLQWMFAELDRAGPLDGLLVAPHGATSYFQPPQFCWITAWRSFRRRGPERALITKRTRKGRSVPGGRS